MFRFHKLPLAALFLMSGLLVIYGCNAPEAEQDALRPAATDTEADREHADHAHDHADHEHADAEERTEMEEMEATLAKLPPKDRKSAMEQHICPVSGEMLGTMGVPKKIEVKGQTVWICCEGCEDKVRAEPEEYLSKIGKAA